jgi:hypothetical protein
VGRSTLRVHPPLVLILLAASTGNTKAAGAKGLGRETAKTPHASANNPTKSNNLRRARRVRAGGGGGAGLFGVTREKT